MKTQEIYEFYKKFKDMSDNHLPVLKSNLARACREKVKESFSMGGSHGSRLSLEEHINVTEGITPWMYQSFITASRDSKITFANFVALCGTLDLDMDKILDPNGEVIRSNTKGAKKKWTYEKMLQFIVDFEENKLDKIESMYELSSGSAETYYKRFKKDLNL